jgi:SAM-dependent methyltransferase
MLYAQKQVGQINLMSVEDRVRWDQIFRKRARDPFPVPDPFLLQYTPSAHGVPLRALDLAGGVGQNALWLAEQGYEVDLIDISRVALKQALSEMGMRNLRRINLLQMDVDALDLQPAEYDLICVFRYLKRSIFPVIKSSVRPGGRVIYESYNLHYLDLVPEFNREFLLSDSELESCFSDWRVLCAENEGHISRLVAINPAR